MDLYVEEHEALDISAGGNVLTYTYDGDAPKSIVCRVTAGDADAPIAGAGTYTVRVSLNAVQLSPNSDVTVGSGIQATVLQSREIWLRQDDELVVELIGKAGDTAVNTAAVLLDTTPLTRAEIYGSGSISVDHNYGGTDNYRYVTSGGVAVDNAQIQAFLRSDYEDGHRGAAFVVGESSTRADGRWARSMQLDPGDYILTFFKPGAYGVDTADLTVTE
jgi:hypothetical protein